jgi:hypothetical protein
MKRSLWIAIGVLALLALVALTFLPSREGFSVPAQLTPEYIVPAAQVDAIISRLPATFTQTATEDRTAAMATYASTHPQGQLGTPAPYTPETIRQHVTAILTMFTLYLHEKGKIGDNVTVEQTDVDDFVVTRFSGPALLMNAPQSARLVLSKLVSTGTGTAVASGYATELANLGQTAGYTAPPTAASGSSAAASSAPAGSGGTATTTGTTTGGSSTSSAGPNNLLPTTSKLGGRNVFGPLFTSLGDSSAQGGDSSKSNTYPTLLGPNPKPSTRIEGAGVVKPSKNYTLANDGSLPSSAHTGSDEDSRFLPTSRVPGDMDIVDPYRTSQSFQASSYSLRNEPVPFLTDFSAFQR